MHEVGNGTYTTKDLDYFGLRLPENMWIGWSFISRLQAVKNFDSTAKKSETNKNFCMIDEPSARFFSSALTVKVQDGLRILIKQGVTLFCVCDNWAERQTVHLVSHSWKAWILRSHGQFQNENEVLQGA